ncbi:MAG: hypothetical protein QG562_404 [Patescibacteria group bacterium]|nr:hypothetical protein [Patescibacteria group bacterium]
MGNIYPNNHDTTLFQQDIEINLGWPAGSTCAAVCLYTEALKNHYNVGSPEDFINYIARFNTRDNSGSWIRPNLSSALRKIFGIRVVSWNTANPIQDLDKMVDSGYIESAEEIDFFNNEILGKTVVDIVDNGHTVVTTVSPGFATNTRLHAIVLSPIEPIGTRNIFFDVYNPDKRCSQTIYPRKYVEEALAKGGACSIILPKLS